MGGRGGREEGRSQTPVEKKERRKREKKRETEKERALVRNAAERRWRPKRAVAATPRSARKPLRTPRSGVWKPSAGAPLMVNGDARREAACWKRPVGRVVADERSVCPCTCLYMCIHVYIYARTRPSTYQYMYISTKESFVIISQKNEKRQKTKGKKP